MSITKNTPIIFIIALLLLLFEDASKANAQNIDFGIRLNGALPKGSFAENVNGVGIGFDGDIGYQIPESPITIGFNLGFINYGTRTRTETFNSNIREVKVKVRTRNNIVTGHFFTRFEPNSGAVRPFVDALAGINYPYTESEVSDAYDNFQDPIAQTTNFKDLAVSAGLSGGIKIKLYQNFNESTGKNYKWFLNLKGKYILGGEARYLQEGALSVVDGIVRLDPSKSRIDFITIGIGITAHIN